MGKMDLLHLMHSKKYPPQKIQKLKVSEFFVLSVGIIYDLSDFDYN